VQLTMSKPAYPLTSVRFFAASLVLFHHSVRVFLPAFSARGAQGVPRDLVGIVTFAFPVSVSFFFFLSGYVLSFVYLHNVQTFNTRSFFAARFARLYPLYFVVLVLATPQFLVTEVKKYGTNIGLAKTAGVFAANVFMLQVWKAQRLVRINQPSWSLCVEVVFYLCFPLLGVELWKLRGVRLWMTAFVLYVGGQALVWMLRAHFHVQTVLTLPPLHLPTFALGILLARWQTLQLERKGSLPTRVWQVHTVLASSAGGLLASIFLIPYFRVRAPYHNGTLAPVFAGFVWALSVISTPSAFPMGDHAVLCGIPGALYWAEPGELPLFRDPHPALVVGMDPQKMAACDRTVNRRGYEDMTSIRGSSLCNCFRNGIPYPPG
jgi:peptidoglycan/LPS O-acetylase OafA/YrhL